MRQRMKRILLVLVMVICFAALSACGKTASYDTTVPETTASYMTSFAEQFVQLLNQSDDATLEAYRETAEKQKDTVLENAIKGWQNSKDDLGAFQSILDENTSVVDDGVYQTVVTAQYEKRICTFSLSCEEEYTSGQAQLKPTELSITPAYTTGEKMAKAGLNTLMGMGTVFIVLIFISFLISRFKYIHQWEENKKKKAAAAAAAAAPVPAAPKAAPKAAPAPAPAKTAAPAPAPAPAPAEPMDDLELVAVITAAVSAASGVPADQLVVRSIRRRSARRWHRA